MKSIIGIITIAGLSYLLGMYFPWWSLAIASFIVALILQTSPISSFTIGFVGVFLLWVLLATLIDIQNEHLLSTRIAGILPLGGNPFLLILVGGILGGLVGGLSALSASYLFIKPNKRLGRSGENYYVRKRRGY